MTNVQTMTNVQAAARAAVESTLAHVRSVLGAFGGPDSEALGHALAEVEAVEEVSRAPEAEEVGRYFAACLAVEVHRAMREEAARERQG